MATAPPVIWRLVKIDYRFMHVHLQ